MDSTGVPLQSFAPAWSFPPSLAPATTSPRPSGLPRPLRSRRVRLPTSPRPYGMQVQPVARGADWPGPWTDQFWASFRLPEPGEVRWSDVSTLFQ